MNHVIHHEIDYEASPDAIYQILTGPGKFSQMTGGAPAEIDPKTGGEFSLFGGMVVGINIECSPGERLVQAWRPVSLEPGVYSMVRFELKAHNGGTRVVLDHTDTRKTNKSTSTKGGTTTTGVQCAICSDPEQGGSVTIQHRGRKAPFLTYGSG